MSVSYKHIHLIVLSVWTKEVALTPSGAAENDLSPSVQSLMRKTAN